MSQNPSSHKSSITKHKISIYSSVTDTKTDYSSITNLMIKKDINVKIATILSTFVLSGLLALSLGFSFYFNDHRILTFEYNLSASDSVYQANLVIFYTLLFFIAGKNNF